MSTVRRLPAFLRSLWVRADLDAADLHYYPGVVLIAAGLALVGLSFGALYAGGLGLLALGLGLIYPARRRGRDG